MLVEGNLSTPGLEILGNSRKTIKSLLLNVAMLKNWKRKKTKCQDRFFYCVNSTSELKSVCMGNYKTQQKDWNNFDMTNEWTYCFLFRQRKVCSALIKHILIWYLSVQFWWKISYWRHKLNMNNFLKIWKKSKKKNQSKMKMKTKIWLQ